MSSDPNSQNDDNQRSRRRGPGGGNVGSWFWLALVGAVLFLVFFGNNLQGRGSIAYSQFLEALGKADEAAKIAKVVYRDETRLEVSLHKGKDGKEQTLEFSDGKKSNSRFEVRLPQKDDKLLARLQELSAGGKITIVQEEDPLAGIGTLIMFFLPAIVILALFFFILPRMRDPLGGGFLSNYIRSPARKYEKGKTRITFEDVAGMENAKAELREIVDFLKSPEKFTRLGATVPKGVLLFGSPGTGKTLLAKAVAGEAGVPFYSINGSEFIQMFVGVGASRVRDMFKTAKENAPCILFIDEIDAVGRMRGAGVGGGSDEREQTLNQILSEMDGFQPSETVIVMAATNRPDVLDSALLRPGRFDRHITVERPTWQGRLAILKVHTRNKPLSDDVNLELIARKMVGMTGADLRNLANEAALLATREGKDRLHMADFERAADRVLIGPKREEVLTGDDKKRIANHEAGHALVTWLMPGADRPQKVSIIPRGQSLGVTITVPDEDRFHHGRDQFERELVMTLGGRAADVLVYNQPYAGAESDLRKATRRARMMVAHWGMSDRVGPMAFRTGEEHVFLGKEIHEARDFSEGMALVIDEEVSKILREADQKAFGLLQSNRNLLDAFVEELTQREEMSRPEIEEVLVKAGWVGTPSPSLEASAV
ncbi:MAG: ATP-dependent zinc metalloprotease FtsH [Planctomycetes bacterium]|nr:ATP-dependent zinc metalloprotease FtsH [Planctomycetota bacterium]